MKGMRCSVYRESDRSGARMKPTASMGRASTETTDGPSRTCDHLTLIGGRIPELSKPTQEAPAARFVRRLILGKQRPCIQPLEPQDYQFGGNFLFSSDSRFPWPFPVPIHDRTKSSLERN